MIHRHPIRVYYEDTDLAGIVYYANYLKFLERGRSEMVRAAGISQVEMKAQGLVFAVRRVEADYLRPAHFEDLLSVETRMGPLKGASFDMPQRVLRGDEVLLEAVTKVVVLNAAGRATRLPADIRAKLIAIAADDGE
ncbi:4-hydroxybenzoyl-CoA thioesterase family active site protein [Roseibacterium elongatum DSM 19469]|uniref:4-hydroxybenzoyl-CoA thioesterase family active site protein n=1 Tax=Roseicyclus elongatus DSM 19469 TaxID=1294273 RepID=W8RSW0_9RHOB|nr:tol-pal system-associated acyl-CoA thioesterase [Roseibacterium elongatum]AHM04228.1 4-hydroxybenzoyl-CoA thioesterase family active site protein [Roseibacterium elongatum DSM 19469]